MRATLYSVLCILTVKLVIYPYKRNIVPAVTSSEFRFFFLAHARSGAVVQ